jgi:hypothetical protein
MKCSTVIFLLLITLNIFGQTNPKLLVWVTDDTLLDKEYKESFLKYDFGALWTEFDNRYTYGIIGNHFQRLKIKIISATKDSLHPEIYHIYGKSMVKGNICSFSGTIEITSIRLFKNLHYGVDEEYKNKGIEKQGILSGIYRFAENSSQTHAGIFEGRLSTLWYLNKEGQIVYDAIEQASDNYRNNQFAGTWKGYHSTVTKICNWGDFRVPLAGGLDMGAGFFSPADGYLQYGWQNLRNAINNDKQAIKEEYREWWK